MNSLPASVQALDTWRLDAPEARALWEDVVHDTYAFLPSDGQVSGHRVKARLWLLDDILLSQFEAEANSLARTPDLVRKTPSELIKLKIYLDGHMDIFDDSGCGRLGPGAISFIDHDRATRQVSTHHRQLSVFLPYHLIGFDPSKHPAWFQVGANSAIGRLIDAGVMSVFSSLDEVDTGDAPALAAGLAGLIRGAIDGGFENADSSDFRTARVVAIRQFVEKSLADPALGAEMILASFGVSRTTLYREFEEFGGIQRYIQHRRLHRAFRLLSESLPSRGVVGAVAERTGFSSVHRFSRVFRERFGETPGAVVGRWSLQDESPSSVHSRDEAYPPEFAKALEKLRWAYGRYGSAG